MIRQSDSTNEHCGSNENKFNVDHVNIADMIIELGMVYNSQDKYDKEIAQYEPALWIYDNGFGVDHINTANMINNLGNTYDCQGKHVRLLYNMKDH